MLIDKKKLKYSTKLFRVMCLKLKSPYLTKGKKNPVALNTYKGFKMSYAQVMWIARNIHWIYAAGLIETPKLTGLVKQALEEFILKCDKLRIDHLEEEDELLGYEISNDLALLYFKALRNNRDDKKHLKYDETGCTRADGIDLYCNYCEQKIKGKYRAKFHKPEDTPKWVKDEVMYELSLLQSSDPKFAQKSDKILEKLKPPYRYKKEVDPLTEQMHTIRHLAGLDTEDM